MAKKPEFRPDKPYSNWLNKLYLTQKQRRKLLKWTLYALVLLILSILQDVVLCHMRIFGATTDLVPCGIFVICLIEGSHTGSVFALVSALLYTFSGTAPGPYCIAMITVLAIGMTLFRQSYLQKGFIVTVIGSVLTVFVYEMLLFLIGVAFGYTLWNRWIGFVTTAALTSIAAPILYPISLAIASIGGETWKE